MIAQTRRRRALLYTAASGIVLAFFILMLSTAEIIARRLEPKAVAGLTNVADPVIGWLPAPGEARGVSSEFDKSISVNSLNMNDREFGPIDFAAPNRVLALGDSHTFAIGASTLETWPKQLEKRIFSRSNVGIVMNGGVIGYSIGQYLLRYRMLRDRVSPTLIILGFSMATDLYDLIPPERGGFVYGGNASRHYFDLGKDGELLEKIYNGALVERVENSPNTAEKVKGFLEEFALFRGLKRSNLAMWVAMYFRPGGKSLWPGSDTAVKINLDEDDTYRWQLAEKMLGQLNIEVRSKGAKLIIVNIPYLAQVYDTVWENSFGLKPDLYDRDIGMRRLLEICDRINADYIDLTLPMRERSKATGKWLHWPLDAHPTPEGHEVIANVIASALEKKQLLLVGGEPRRN